VGTEIDFCGFLIIRLLLMLVVNHFQYSTNVGKKIVPVNMEQVPNLWYSDVRYYLFIGNKQRIVLFFFGNKNALQKFCHFSLIIWPSDYKYSPFLFS
jgi:hypothetical protein